MALRPDDDRCECGWERPLCLDFDGIEAEVLQQLPVEFSVLYQCPRCGIEWSALFEKSS